MLGCFWYQALGQQEKILWRVKQLDQFIGRFNGEEDLWGDQLIIPDLSARGQVDEDTLDTNFQDSITVAAHIRLRRNILPNLIDHSCGCFPDSLFVPFLLTITNQSNPIYLDFYDNNWYAKVKGRVTYELQEMEIELTLQQEYITNVGSKWVIGGAYAPWLMDTNRVPNPEKIIHPMSHEMNFLALKRAFRDHKNIELYAIKPSWTDQLRNLFGLIKKQKLSYQHTREITYHFLQVPGWIFVVQHFDRNTNNAGWLIAQVMPATAAEKALYKQKTLHLIP